MSALVPDSADYKKLVSDITRLYHESRQALVKAYWQIGQRIVEVEQKGSARATHGAALIQKLSRELTPRMGAGFSETNLKRFRRFYLANPKGAPAPQLTWAHHTELLTIHDETKRHLFEKRASEKSLNRDDLRALIRQEGARALVEENLKDSDETNLNAIKLLKPVRGKVGVYRIIRPAVVGRAESELLVDLGFSCYHEINTRGLKEGDRVELVRIDAVKDLKRPQSETTLKKSSQTLADLFTYKATVEKIVDGDTLRVIVDLGLSTRTRQTLRLRGIDCPEIKTQEGKQAADFVKAKIRIASEITITSSRSDKYDRYLADVYYQTQDGEKFLNNELLAKGLAVRW